MVGELSGVLDFRRSEFFFRRKSELIFRFSPQKLQISTSSNALFRALFPSAQAFSSGSTPPGRHAACRLCTLLKRGNHRKRPLSSRDVADAVVAAAAVVRSTRLSPCTPPPPTSSFLPAVRRARGLPAGRRRRRGRLPQHRRPRRPDRRRARGPARGTELERVHRGGAAAKGKKKKKRAEKERKNKTTALSLLFSHTHLFPPIPTPTNSNQVRGRQEAKRASIEAQFGDSLLKVELAERIDPFDCWLWFEAGGDKGNSSSKSSSSSKSWTVEDAELLDGVLTAWFMLGRLGAFNSSNLQLSQGQGIAQKEYDVTQLASASTSVFHDFSPRSDLDDGRGGVLPITTDDGALEIQGSWARAWVNCGTADELAFDVLLNALATLASEEVPALSKVVVGGELPWWPVPKRAKGMSGGGGGGEGEGVKDKALEGLMEGDF